MTRAEKNELYECVEIVLHYILLQKETPTSIIAEKAAMRIGGLINKLEVETLHKDWHNDVYEDERIDD